MEDKKEAKNLMEGLLDEMNRVREILEEYKSIGPPGMFGVAMIQGAINQAEKAIASNDVIKMIQCYEELKEISN